jgi:tRNA dimethylallyltransferase
LTLLIIPDHLLFKKNKTLLIIAGPTAVGKTDLSINLAKKFKTSIVSADSRQFFKEMNIGTSKPTSEELKQIKHYFINSLSVTENYDVRKFEKETLRLLDALFSDHDLVILTGGSGLYLDAISYGFDEIPTVDVSKRVQLNAILEKDGIGVLQEQLRLLDPIYYAKVDLNNPQRIIRALEICIGTGKSFSSFLERKVVKRPFKIIKIALQRERKELYDRIDSRMDQMIAEGLFEEAISLYPMRHYNALQTVGYKEIFGYMEQRYDKEETIRLLKRNSRRYAKRQMTWFRRNEEYHWFHPSMIQEITDFVIDQMGE